MNSSFPIELCLCALWSALIFASGVLCGHLLAKHNPPGDGDSSSGQSPTEETP